MPTHLPPPGPSFLREQEVRLGDRVCHAGMARPSTGPDDWWLTVLWIRDPDGIVSFSDAAPAAGPPPEPPLARLGPALAGGLSGLIREVDGRLAIRLGLIAPPDDGAEPWASALAIRAGFRWEPARAATLRQNQLANEVLTAFRRAVESLGGRRSSAA